MQISGLQESSVKQTARLIYQTALMESGFMLNDPKDFASGIYNTVKASLNINPDAVVEDEDDVEEDAEVDSKGDAADDVKEDIVSESDVKDEL